jgi:AraC-like DNA-binding protein
MRETVFSQNYGCHMDLYFCGERKHTAEHEFGPVTRNHYLIVLVTEGEAELYLGDTKVLFGKGDILIDFPGVPVHYRALSDWSNKWVGVGSADLGLFLEKLGITPAAPVIKCGNAARFEAVMDEILAMSPSPYPSQSMRLGRYLYELAELIAKECEGQMKPPTIRSNEILRYIAANYQGDIRVAQIAERYHLDRSYLERSFKKETGQSIREAVIGFRIRRAQTLLRETSYSVEEVSKRSGFRDRLYFSRFFHKKFGLTPTEYRRQSREGRDREQFDKMDG